MPWNTEQSGWLRSGAIPFQCRPYWSGKAQCFNQLRQRNMERYQPNQWEALLQQYSSGTMQLRGQDAVSSTLSTAQSNELPAAAAISNESVCVCTTEGARPRPSHQIPGPGRLDSISNPTTQSMIPRLHRCSDPTPRQPVERRVQGRKRATAADHKRAARCRRPRLRCNGLQAAGERGSFATADQKLGPSLPSHHSACAAGSVTKRIPRGPRAGSTRLNACCQTYNCRETPRSVGAPI